MLQRILLVDDEPLARERLAALVRAHAPDAAIKEAGDGEAAVEAILGWAPDLVLLDIQMPGASGVEVVER
ncbi:MAG: response regulator, partial [Gemmatimonadaceae bacterium]|nr:response regulator [Gemmatimonadaceae bacterium]